MATASAGALYRVGTVNVTNGSTAIVGTGSQWVNDVIAIAIGDLFTLDMKTWYEVTAITDDTNLTLDRGFEGGTASNVNYGIVRSTSGTVLTRIAGQITVQFNQKQLFLDELRTWLNSTNATENVTDSHGLVHSITTPTQMEAEHATRVAQVDSLVGSVQAMTKAEFDALAEKRIRESAGSGFSEWGKVNSVWEAVNEGFGAVPTVSNQIRLGRSTSPTGSSATNNPIAIVNGAQVSLKNTGSDSDINCLVTFPDAPDGLDKADGTGRFTDLAAAIVAGGSGLTASVISRKDFVFLEVWHEKISDKDAVYPLGNVQYGSSSWNSVALSNTLVAQGYSAFGDWDSTTKGYGVKWSTLSAANQTKFIQDHENNIYSDNGELIQVRYRIRVVKGLGDSWVSTDPNSHNAVVNYDYMEFTYNGTSRVNAKGILTFQPDFGTGGDGFISSFTSTSLEPNPLNGQFVCNGQDNLNIAHNGLCFAIPIALVQRRNQGVYDVVYNSSGCSTARNIADNGNAFWYQSTARTMTSLSDCFDVINTPAITKAVIGTSYPVGRPDGKYYDAIYASDVQDLRMSSKRLPLSEIREKYKRMAIAGEVRGFESVPFTVPVTVGVNTVTTYMSFGNTKPVWWNDNVLGNGATTNQNSKDIIVSDGANTFYALMSGYTTTANLGWYFRLTDEKNSVALGENHPWVGGNIVCVSFTGKSNIKNNHQQANPTWTDIIGDPANIAATFPNGVEGQWIPVIPDATNQTYNFSRKNTDGTSLTYTRSTDLGVTWESGAVTVDTILNAFISTRSAIEVGLMHYQTQAHFTQDDVNSEVLDLGGVIASSFHGISDGALLVSSLIDKVAKGVSSNTNLPTHYSLLRGASRSGYLSALSGNEYEHQAIVMTNPASSTIKTLDYLSQSNDVLKLDVLYKEMIHNGASWGDNNQFEVADNKAIQTDLNGNTILYGTASFNTQYFYDGNQG